MFEFSYCEMKIFFSDFFFHSFSINSQNLHALYPFRTSGLLVDRQPLDQHGDGGKPAFDDLDLGARRAHGRSPRNCG